MCFNIHFKIIPTIGATVVLTAPYLSDSGGSGIMTPRLFIKLTYQGNSITITTKCRITLHKKVGLSYLI